MKRCLGVALRILEGVSGGVSSKAGPEAGVWTREEKAGWPNKRAQRAALSITGSRSPITAGRRARGSWGCAHARHCLLRVASGHRQGTINTARPGSETERRDPGATAQPLLLLRCVTRETLSASLGSGCSFNALVDWRISGSWVGLMGAADPLSRNHAKLIPEFQTKNESIL